MLEASSVAATLNEPILDQFESQTNKVKVEVKKNKKQKTKQWGIW